MKLGLSHNLKSKVSTGFNPFTDPNIKIPGTSQKKKLNSFLYYKKSIYEGERYLEYLMETINSDQYKNLYYISSLNDSRKPVVDKLRAKLIENDVDVVESTSKLKEKKGDK